jgi:hypothetical protein
MVLAHPDRHVTRRVLECFCDNFPHGDVGRWLPVYFRRVGLADVSCQPFVISVSLEFLKNSFQIGSAVRAAEERQLISSAQAAGFLQTLEDTDARGEFFCAATVFMTGGRTT